MWQRRTIYLVAEKEKKQKRMILGPIITFQGPPAITRRPLTRSHLLQFLSPPKYQSGVSFGEYFRYKL
jgi:hypothetical protein